MSDKGTATPVCEVCGRRVIPGVTDSGTPECYRLGFERQKSIASGLADVLEEYVAVHVAPDGVACGPGGPSAGGAYEWCAKCYAARDALRAAGRIK